MRNYQLLAHLCELSDEVLVNAEEIAELTGLAPRTVQQRRLPNFPQPMPRMRRLRWRLGDIRAWMSHQAAVPMPQTKESGGSRRIRHGS
jgi:predicted DNA-binding transcriptional regulator AlpA